MEAWRQWLLGEEKTLSNEKAKNPLDSDRPSHGRRLHSKPLSAGSMSEIEIFNRYPIVATKQALAILEMKKADK
jgi:hypothetical protein